jgi:ketosteroid isomerase-like protein
MRHAERLGSVLVAVFVLVEGISACRPSAPLTGDPVASARAVLSSHEQAVKAADLDAIVANAAEDIVVMVPGAPLMEGRDAVRQFYTQFLATGSTEFQHHFAGEQVVGQAVVVHGVAQGTTTGADGTVTPFENNFMMVLKPDAAGQMKIWRVAFAPTSM